MENNSTLNAKYKEPLLAVKDFSLSFVQYTDGFEESLVDVVKNFELTINAGEIVAVLGSSGSGKSLFADAILGILPENAKAKGTMYFENQPLTAERQDLIRGKEIALIPQSVKALDPLMKAGKQVQNGIRDRKDKKRIQEEVFQKLGLPKGTANLYPFELSGGMARRVLIATAMVGEAKLIIADEPTPGLDKANWEETLSHIKQLADANIGIMFITHDIYAALEIADKIAVFYAGETIEIAKKEDFSGQGENLKHPYTKALWRALPENDFIPLKGSQPQVDEIITGCIFSPRCPIATDLCREKKPESTWINNTMVRCLYARN